MKQYCFCLLVTLFLLTACGGSSATPAGETVISRATLPPQPTPELDEAVVEEKVTTGEAENQDNANNNDEESETAETENEQPATGADDTGLPVNPDPIVPGEPYVIEGFIINAAMIPLDAPQFLIEGDNGIRYRLNSQPADEIFTSQGTQLLPHQIGRGLRIRATALLPIGATEADVPSSDDLVIILEE